MTQMNTTATLASAMAPPKTPRKKRAKTTRRVVAKSPRAKATRSCRRKPASLEEARQELLREVCAQSKKITAKLVEEALAGRHLCAKFLFEAVGLCEIRGDEFEEAGERESLAALIMKQWQLPSQPAAESETAGDQVTEVLEAVPDSASSEQAPVES